MENKSGIRAAGKMPQRNLRNWLDPTHLNMCMYLNDFSFRKESHVVPCLHGPLRKCFPNSDMWALRNLSILILGVLTMSKLIGTLISCVWYWFYRYAEKELRPLRFLPRYRRKPRRPLNVWTVLASPWAAPKKDGMWSCERKGEAAMETPGEKRWVGTWNLCQR